MKTALTYMFAIGWIDLFNPVAISTVMLLIPLVRKRWHTLIYVVGAYIAYASASIGIYLGVDTYLKGLYLSVCEKYPTAMNAGRLLLGVLSLIGCVFMVRFLYKCIKEKRKLSMDSMLMIKSVSPWFIAALSFGSTWSNMFSAFAMFTYIGFLMANGLPTATIIVFIPIFCLFSTVPTLGVFLLSHYVKGERFQRIMDKVRTVMTGFCFYSIPVLLAVIAWWGIIGTMQL